MVPSPMSDPVLYLPCSKLDSNNVVTDYNFLVRVNQGSNPSLAVLYRFNKGTDTMGTISGYNQRFDAADSGRFTAYPYSTKPTDRAFAFYAFSGQATPNDATSFRPTTFNLVRMRMNGTYTETQNPTGQAASDIAAAQWGSVPELPPMSAGIVLHAFLNKRHYTATTGGFGEGVQINFDAAAPMELGRSGFKYAPNTVIGGADTANLIRIDGPVDITSPVDGDLLQQRQSYYFAPFSLNLTTNVGVTGEVLTESGSTYGQPIWHLYYDDLGNLNALIGNVQNKYSWIQWNALVPGYSNLSNVVGNIPGVSITSQDTNFVLTAVGGKITFTGTGLTGASAISIGGTATTIVSKKDTSLVVNLPKNLALGEEPIEIRFGNSGAITKVVTYLAGSVKQNQNIAAPISLPSDHTRWSGNNFVVTVPALTDVNLPVAVKLSPITTCTMVNNVPTIIGAGTCTIAISQAGDLGTNKASRSFAVIIDKGVLNTIAGNALTLTDNPSDDGSVNNQFNTSQLVPTSDFASAVYAYTADNSEVCTVDDSGIVTGISAGNCVVTVSASGGPNWIAETRTVSVTVAASSNPNIPDILPSENDGILPAVNVPGNSPNTYVQTNDPALSVKWDKAKGLLSVKSSGIYTGYISTQISFTDTVHNITYVCTNVFGTVKALPKKTSAQKKAAMKSKSFVASAASCKDTFGISVPGVNGVPGNLGANFAKIKKVAKAKGNSTTQGTKAYEAAAQLALKGFIGTVTITTTRYRAWPTTMKNVTGHTPTTKRIPSRIRITVLSLH